MNGVILYADDDVLNRGTFENKLFLKFHDNSKYPVLPITNIQDLEKTIKSLSTIRVLILDWEFKVPKEDQDMPEKTEKPLEILKNYHIYSLVYIYSRNEIEEEIRQELINIYGENKIFFKLKAIGNNESQEYDTIYKNILKFEADHKHMELPFIWSQSINHFIHSIFNELETASPNWIQEIRDTAKKDGAEPVSEIINIFNNLLNESIIQNKTLRDALNAYSYENQTICKNEDETTCKNKDKTEENTAKLYQRIFYTKITDDAPMMTGDIFKFNDNEYGILITPECDLSDTKKDSYDFLIIKKGESNKYQADKTKLYKKEEKVVKQIFNNGVQSRHILISFPFEDNKCDKIAVIEFCSAMRVYKQIDENDKKISSYRTEYKLNSPYLQQLRQRYISFFGRYGVPAIPETLRDFNLSG